MELDHAGFLPRERLDALIERLAAGGRRVVGPVARDGAVVMDTVHRAAELPRGTADTQAPGAYRLGRHDPASPAAERLFAWANGPQGLKPLLFAPQEPLWRSVRDESGSLRFEAVAPDAPAVAVLGARACDVAALALQDRHFLDGPFVDPHYAARRGQVLVVAVDCSHPADTCFCVSTGDGPSVSAGFDIALTELDDGYLVRAATAAGREVLADLSLEPVTAAHRAAADDQHHRACERQSRALPARNLRDALLDNLEHPRWDDVAARCLACGNCTSVCPSCFCHAEADTVSLDHASSEHTREWDSCFTQRHSQMHGYKVRPHIRQRYRQWLVHKLGTWHDQYGRSGCTGCGRCITWCPVGIDITVEATAICTDEGSP
ncbi:MAG: 4Fe-4S dicluster domain-containing protein [Ectothiorhodospiraceae bacterium]|nr:4Fe-4S dicluster domain-containing protein [Ectothiorhodospiraceae bacterium]